MTVRVKWGGTTWKDGDDPGTIKMKWNDNPPTTATTWKYPSYMFYKWGGGWIDSGYRGFPAVPTNLAVNSWPTHEAVKFQWLAGAGGAPVSGYDVAINNESGSNIAYKENISSPSADFTEVAQGTKYLAYVRSRTAGGLVSAWVGGLKIKMGVDAYSYDTSYPGSTRAYSVSATVNGYRDAPVGVWTLNTVAVSSIRYQIRAEINPNTGQPFTSVLSPFNNREIRRWSNSAQSTTVFSWGQPIDVTVPVSYTSDGGVQGMICRGTGWATTATSFYTRAIGTITVNGIETYTKVVTTNVPAVDNGYW